MAAGLQACWRRSIAYLCNQALVGLFLYGQEPEPPPFPLTEERTAGLLGPSFRLLRTELVAESVPVHQGLECWQDWEKIAV